MNKRSLIICICSLLFLVLLIVVSVFFLYSDKGNVSSSGKDTAPVETPECALLQAVPSDAAMVVSFSKLSEAISILNDETLVLGTLLTDAVRSKHPFSDFISQLKDTDISSLKNSESIISVHYSGSLEPLFILSNGSVPADTSKATRAIMALSDSLGLHHNLVDCSKLVKSSSPLKKSSLLLVSASETLLLSSERHLEGNTSVIDKKGFAHAASYANGDDVLYISHDYASKWMSSYFQKPYSSYGSFLGNFADWTALAIGSFADDKMNMSGAAACPGDEDASFVAVLDRSKPGDAEFTSVVPSSALFALSISSSDMASYFESYKKYLDAAGKLERYEQAVNSVNDSLEISPMQWAERLQLKELALAEIEYEDEYHNLLFVRVGSGDADIILKGSGKENLKDCVEVHPNVYRSFLKTLFGSIFTVNDSYCIYRDGWLIYGEERALESLGGNPLSELLGSMGLYIPGRVVNLSAYFSATKAKDKLPAIFKPVLAESFVHSMAGVTDKAMVLSFSGKKITLNSARAELAPDPETLEQMAADATVEVYAGPFRVKNSASGRINIFSQSENGSLSLKEESGKGIWAIPFEDKLCGRVETIDYYANGKLQYLFAAGDKLYLIDRLGRFVKSFPVSLGKKVVLGPAAYDFTGAHGYTAMILHEDNTIVLYDLHGKVKSGWKDISPKETIMSLPELITVKNKKYWAVRTSVQTLIYDFMGGEPLTTLTGDKRISPDSEIQVKDGSISATSLDGKVRNVKL